MEDIITPIRMARCGTNLDGEFKDEGEFRIDTFDGQASWLGSGQ